MKGKGIRKDFLGQSFTFIRCPESWCRNWKERCFRPWQANISNLGEQGWPLRTEPLKSRGQPLAQAPSWGWSGSWDTLAGEGHRRGSQTHLTVPHPPSTWGISPYPLTRIHLFWYPQSRSSFRFTHTSRKSAPSSFLTHNAWGCSNSPVLPMKKQTWGG